MSLRLFILEPDIVFSGLINQASITYPLDEFEYDGVITGTYSVVYLNQTVVFGSSESDSSLGRSRIRKFPTSNTMYIGRSSQGNRDGEADLSDNDTFTVYALYQVWSKIPYIDSAGETFMDSDLDFATYGTPPPVANAGPAFASTVNGSSIITVNFSAGNSFTMADGASISTYLWEVDDGTITVGTSASSSITATFPPGFRYVTLTVTDSNAKIHQTHVPVLAMAANYSNCVNNFEIDSHRITPEGQDLSVTIREDIDAATFIDGTLVMLIDGDADDGDDRSNVVFCGWIQDEENMIRAQRTGTLKDATLRCVDVAGRMKELPGFPRVLEHNDSPSTWEQYDTPNMHIFLHHLLQWQSTALDLADYIPAAGVANYPFKVLASEGASLWEQVSRRARALVPDYLLTCSRRGELSVMVDPQLQDSGDRTSTVQTTLTAAHYSDIQYQYTRHPRVHWLRSNAIIADTNVVDAVFCIAPGDAPGQGETEMTHGEQLSLDQASLNAVTGHRYARLNARDARYRITLAQAATADLLSPSDLTWVQLTIPASMAGQRGRTLTTARGLVQEINLRYNDRGRGLERTATLLWEREVSGTPAATVIVEVADPVDPTDPLVPDVETAEPDFNPPGTPTALNQVGMVSNQGHIYRTDNFLDASPNWTRYGDHQSDFGVTVTVLDFVVDPFSPLYRTGSGAVNGWIVTLGAIWYLEDMFGTTTATNQLAFPQNISTSQGRWRAINASFGRYQADEADNPWLICISNYGELGTKKGIWATYSVDAGQTWATEGQVAGAPAYDTGIPSGDQNLRPAVWLSPRTPGYAITFSADDIDANNAKVTFESDDWGATWTEMTTSPLSPGVSYGGSLHVPWPDNSSEVVAYYGSMYQNEDLWRYYTHRRNAGGSISEISPTGSGQTYGPRQWPFGIRSFDNDRRYVAMAGFRNGVDNEEIDDYAAAFVSDDYGDTWTEIVSPVNALSANSWPIQVAFAGNDRNTIYLWGNRYISYTTDFGATVEDKTGDISWDTHITAVGLFGGLASP